MKTSQVRKVREVTYMKVFTVGLNQPLKHLKGAETQFPHPPILLWVRPQSTLRGLLPKAPVVYGFVWLLNFEPRLGPIKPTNGSIVGTRICLEMSDVASLESN